MSVSEIPECIHALRAEVCVVERAEGVCTKKLRVPKFVPWNEPLGEVPIKSDIRMLFVLATWGHTWYYWKRGIYERIDTCT